MLSVLMWDSPLYVVNMFYYHWLIKMLIWLMAGQNTAKQGIQRDRGKNAESGRCKQQEARCEITSHEPVVKYKLVEMR